MLKTSHIGDDIIVFWRLKPKPLNISYTFCIINYTLCLNGDIMIAAKIKKWGNSYGILIPKNELHKMNLGENQEVIVDISKKENPLKEMFGFAKKSKLKKSTKQIIKEVRSELGVD